MKRMAVSPATAVVALAVGLAHGPAWAIEITNGLDPSEVGYWRVDVQEGGNVFQAAFITGQGTPSGSMFVNERIVYEYLTLIGIGPLGRADPLDIYVERIAELRDGKVVSSGTFEGENHNTINWTVSSEIPEGGSVMTSRFEFHAETGTLGHIRLHQYLDEDVLDYEDDVFFTRGSAASGNLKLFTVDDAEAIGVSHSGALVAAQGLMNASFSGWAACIHNLILPSIEDGTLGVSPTGIVCDELLETSIEHSVVGPGYGPADIVSTMAWDVDPEATSAVIITTLGGVAEPPPPPADEAFVCAGDGFLPPFHVPLTLNKREARAIRVAMVLEDSNGIVITDQDLASPPLINVAHTDDSDVTNTIPASDLLPQGQANTDNIFRFDPTTGTWIYNLGTKQFGAAGAYDVTALPGDSSYEIDVSCSGTFDRK